MELTHVIFTVLIAATSAQHEPPFGFAVSGYGPLASINLWWEEYPCSTPVFYRLELCQVGSKCFRASTVTAEYTLRSGPVIPVVFWSHYHVTVNGTCGNDTVRLQEFYADTGPGELLPLENFSERHPEGGVELTFGNFSATTQDAAENLELVICDIHAGTCLESKNFDISVAGYNVKNALPGVLYSAAVRLMKKFEGKEYSSITVTIPFSHNRTAIEESGVDYNVSRVGPYAEINLSWERYGCDDNLISYDVACCSKNFGCFHESANNETRHTIKTRPELPIVFWEAYDIYISAVCNGVTSKHRRRFAPTGPGDLLPLTTLSVVPDDGVAIVSFERPDWRLQNLTRNIEVTVCPTVGNTSCVETSFNIENESLRLENLELGILYNISARLTAEFLNETHASQAVTHFFSLGEKDDATGIRANVTGNGPNAEINLVWDPYPCAKGPLIYNLTICRNRFGCIEDSANNETTYTLRSRPGFPVVFWNSYSVAILGFCDGVLVGEHKKYVNTGPGELLPLTRFSVDPEEHAVRISFATPDRRTQSAAQNVEMTVCDAFANQCLAPRQVSINDTSYRFEGLNQSVVYNVSARLSTEFNNDTYTSRALTISVITGDSSADIYPPVENAAIVSEQSVSGVTVTVTVNVSMPTNTRGKSFVGVYVQLFDAEQDSNLANFRAEGEQFQIPNLAFHQLYRISVRAMYLRGWQTRESVARDVFFFTDGGDATKSGFNVTAHGPEAQILVWWERFPCRTAPASYKLTACLGDTCIHQSTENTNSTVKDGYGFPVLLWNSYRITIEASCSGSSVKWQEFYADTGSGELLPLQMLSAIPDGHAVNISYVKPNKFSQNVAENVEIVFCDVLAPACFDARKVPIEEAGHRFDDLKFGVLYNVSARLTKELGGNTYRSKALSSTFTTAQANETDFLPVETLSVKFESTEMDGYVRATLTCSEPADTRGKTFRGIFVELFDEQMKQTSTIKSSETQMELPPLPLYRTFRATVYAVYSEGRDSVRSVGRQITFFTHFGDVFVPKPEIVKLFPVNGTSALISWTHPSKNSLAFTYKITRKQLSNYEVSVVDDISPQTRTLLIQDLKPDKEYTVSVTAYVQSDRALESSSDAREITMLPRDALIPTLQVTEFGLRNQLELTWKVIISPEIKNNCTFLALACPDDNACDESITNGDLMNVTIDILPYTNYTLRVRTECKLGNDIHVTADSNTYQYNTSEILAPVEHIHQHPINLTAVALSWTTLPNQTYTGFYVQWTQVGGDGYWTDFETHKSEMVLTELQPASIYKVSVKGVRQYGKRAFRSQPTSTEVFSLFPAPPPPTDLKVKQVELTSMVKTSWTKVASAFGTVEYKVMSTCAADETRWTNATEILIKASNITTYETECVVEVSACVKNLRNTSSCSPTTGMSLIFTTLPAPEEVQAKYYSDKVYKVTITPPPKLKDLENLEYQVTRESGEYGPRVNKNDKATLEESRYNERVERKARLCINDLCGKEFGFAFTTNVGAPSVVTNLQASADVTDLSITWEKPVKGNGPIDGYFVTITETRDGKTVVSKDLKENFLKIKMEKEYTSYDIDVRAYNIDKEDPNIKKAGFDSIVTVFTDGTVPPAPSKLDELSSQGHSRIEWEPTPSRLFNVTWFRVFANSTEDKASTTFTQHTVFEFSALRPYTVYDFEVSSCTAEDNATCGVPSKLTKRTDVGYPSRPPVMLVHADISFISIRWTEPDEPFGPINGYEYAYVEKSSGRTPSNWTETLREDRSANFTDLTPKTEYEIHVRAFNLNSEIAPLYSPVGTLTASTEGASSGQVWISILIVLAVLVFCGLAYFGYTRYMQRIRDTPLIAVGPQTDDSPVLEEVDL